MEEDDVEILKPAQRDQKGRLLPGQRSINPKGRPPIIRDIQAAAKQHTRAALNVLIKCMNDCEAPVSTRIQAAEAILNRGWGRPQQNVEARIEVTDIAKTHAEVLMELSRGVMEEKQSRIAEQVIDVTPQRLPARLSG